VVFLDLAISSCSLRCNFLFFAVIPLHPSWHSYILLGSLRNIMEMNSAGLIPGSFVLCTLYRQVHTCMLNKKLQSVENTRSLHWFPTTLGCYVNQPRRAVAVSMFTSTNLNPA
jgi:hypothetical protein